MFETEEVAWKFFSYFENNYVDDVRELTDAELEVAFIDFIEEEVLREGIEPDEE